MTIITEHRPKTLDEMVGNEKAVKTLEGLFARREKFPHAILLSGPKGCGKTTLARIISNMLGAQASDFVELDTAQFGNKETITNLITQTRYRPSDPESECRVWLLDEAHMIGTGGASEKNKAQGALLKTLEQPPAHAYFVLATTDPQRLLPTLRSRCIEISVATLSDNEMELLLRRIMRAEKSRVPSDVRELIIDQSLGHPRNALQLLGKVIGLAPEDMAEVVKEEAEKQTAAIELCQAIFKKKKWSVIAKILQGLKDEDEEGLRRMMLSYCNSILLKQDNPLAFVVLDEFSEPFYNTGKPGLTAACYRATHL